MRPLENDGTDGKGLTLRQALAAEEDARRRYEGERDWSQGAESGRPSLQLLHDQWQEATRRREAVEAELQRWWDDGPARRPTFGK